MKGRGPALGESILNGRYILLAQVLASIGGATTQLGTKGRCRYCGEDDSAFFKTEAHTFPEALGNRWVTSLDECDKCNRLFSKYDDAITKAVGPFLTLGGVKGKTRKIRQTGRSDGPAVLARRDGPDRPGISMFATDANPADHVSLATDGALRLSYIPGQGTMSGSKLSHLPHGPYLKPDEWEKQFAKFGDHFKIAAEILDYFLSPTAVVARPKLMNTLGQALLWFHEGCRETVTLMGIVKFSAAMDALGGGHKSGGIRKVINARLGIKDSDAIRRDGPTMKEAIDRIYSEGRSRTIHGTNEKLGHDWSSMRAWAEQFSRMSLMGCIDWAAKHPASDDPAQLKL